MNHCWRNFQDDCTRNNEKNLPLLQHTNEVKLPQCSLQLSVINKPNICVVSKINHGNYPAIDHDFGKVPETVNNGDNSSTSHQTNVTIFHDLDGQFDKPYKDGLDRTLVNMLREQFIEKELASGVIGMYSEQPSEKDRFYRMLQTKGSNTSITMDISKLSVNMSIVNSWSKNHPWMKKIQRTILKQKKNKLAKNNCWVKRNRRSRNQSTVAITLNDSFKGKLSDSIFDGRLNSINHDICSINLNPFQISASSSAMDDYENCDLIMKMSTLSCKHDILNHRQSSNEIIEVDTIDFKPDLEQTLNRINLGPKIQEINDNEGPKMENFQIEIDEIDKICNLSIQDETYQSQN